MPILNSIFQYLLSPGQHVILIPNQMEEVPCLATPINTFNDFHTQSLSPEILLPLRVDLFKQTFIKRLFYHEASDLPHFHLTSLFFQLKKYPI